MTTTATATDIIASAQALGPVVRAGADATEAGRKLDPGVFHALSEARMFDLVLPRALGGLEVDITTMMRVIEEVSIADGATGWCVGIGVGTSVISGTLPDNVAREIFAPGVVTGGPVAPLGRATPVEGGYRVTGRWPFASGIDHCAWAVGGSIVLEGDAPRMLAPGAPDWRLMLFPKADIEVVDTWRVSGLSGTGSHDIAVKDVFVPEERSIALGVQKPVQTGPLYRFPIFGFLALSIAPVATGIARRAIDELVELAQTKVPTGGRSGLRERAVAQYEIAQAEAELRSCRAFMYEAAAEVWDALLAGGRPDIKQRALLRLACAHATNASARAVDIAYRLGGGSAIYQTSVLQRQFRDIHAATQHILSSSMNYELAGRVLFGLDPGTPAL